MPLLLRCTSLIPRKICLVPFWAHRPMGGWSLFQNVHLELEGLYRPTVPVWRNWFFQDLMTLYINAPAVSLIPACTYNHFVAVPFGAMEV